MFCVSAIIGYTCISVCVCFPVYICLCVHACVCIKILMESRYFLSFFLVNFNFTACGKPFPHKRRQQNSEAIMHHGIRFQNRNSTGSKCKVELTSNPCSCQTLIRFYCLFLACFNYLYVFVGGLCACACFISDMC